MNLEEAHETPEKAQNFFFAHAKTPRTQRGSCFKHISFS